MVRIAIVVFQVLLKEVHVFHDVRVRNGGKIDSSLVKELLYVHEGILHDIMPILALVALEVHEEVDSANSV